MSVSRSKPVARLSYNVNEACAALGVSRFTLYREIAEGKLNTTFIRGCRLIPAQELEALLERGTAEAQATA